MRTAYYETKCGGLTVERRSRRSRTEAQRRKLVRVREDGWVMRSTDRKRTRNGCGGRGTKMYFDRDGYQKSVRRAREERWRVRGRARVVHPKYGAVVVPHRSNYSALLNAAEYWGCE